MSLVAKVVQQHKATIPRHKFVGEGLAWEAE